MHRRNFRRRKKLNQISISKIKWVKVNRRAKHFNLARKKTKRREKKKSKLRLPHTTSEKNVWKWFGCLCMNFNIFNTRTSIALGISSANNFIVGDIDKLKEEQKVVYHGWEYLFIRFSFRFYYIFYFLENIMSAATNGSSSRTRRRKIPSYQPIIVMCDKYMAFSERVCLRK